MGRDEVEVVVEIGKIQGFEAIDGREAILFLVNVTRCVAKGPEPGSARGGPRDRGPSARDGSQNARQVRYL